MFLNVFSLLSKEGERASLRASSFPPISIPCVFSAANSSFNIMEDTFEVESYCSSAPDNFFSCLGCVGTFCVDAFEEEEGDEVDDEVNSNTNCNSCLFSL